MLKRKRSLILLVMSSRKYVFSEAQFKELTSSPSLATAVFTAWSHDPSMTSNEAFRLGRFMLAQYKLELITPPDDRIAINVETGEILQRKVKH
ncbi:hypothetical protein [Microviridae Fen685_11]|uniref:hypothetical protein n=1 Tax=Microviridae Fen685_11 TaxID=1655657 RepID=UPI00063D5D0E|nr:hypothetical protein [Microviridae Fen685_11]AKI26929.1 hypothetical protein [Microviridae Fen685_11]